MRCYRQLQRKALRHQGNFTASIPTICSPLHIAPFQQNTKLIHLKSLKIFGLVYIDHLQHLATFYQEVPAWVAQGKLKMMEDIITLDQAESRFIELQDGLNEGKTIIKLA